MVCKPFVFTGGLIVTRVSLAVVAGLALIGAAACKDAVTSPGNSSDLTLRYGISNPPPPPIDTGASGFFSAADLRAPVTPKFLQPRYSIVQSSSPVERQKLSILAPPGAHRFSLSQNPFLFSVPVTYFFNPTSRDGYLHFSNDPDGVNASSNGMIKNHLGVLSGKGMLQIQTTGGGLLVIDLSSIQQPPSFLGCGTETAGPAATNNGGVCFHLFFSQATFFPPTGPPQQGSAQMDPSCPPENDACFG
jgi:hypothetical protein